MDHIVGSAICGKGKHFTTMRFGPFTFRPFMCTTVTCLASLVSLNAAGCIYGDTVGIIAQQTVDFDNQPRAILPAESMLGGIDIKLDSCDEFFSVSIVIHMNRERMWEQLLPRLQGLDQRAPLPATKFLESGPTLRSN